MTFWKLRIPIYVHTLRHAVTEIDNDTTPLAIELSIPPGGQEIAAVINTDNLRHVTPRKIAFFATAVNNPVSFLFYLRNTSLYNIPFCFPMELWAGVVSKVLNDICHAHRSNGIDIFC